MNKTVLIVLAVLAVLIVIPLMMGISAYNGLVGQEEAVDAAWAQVENVYQRRADLIPNLQATVEGAADFERETFQAVTEARAKVGSVSFNGAPTPEQLAAFQQAQDGLSSALSRLLVTVERYPDLKATQAFRDFQAQLEGTENRITVERGRFNEAARTFNTSRRRFPGSLVAAAFGFEKKAYFESREGSDQPPTVDFGNDG